MIETIKLTNWEVIGSDPYTAPERSRIRIVGTLLNDTPYPRGIRKAGHEIATSPVMDCTGRLVRTAHSIYELVGGPSEKYAKWCSENGITIDPEQPIVMKGRA